MVGRLLGANPRGFSHGFLVGFDELGDFEGKVMVAMPENVNG